MNISDFINIRLSKQLPIEKKFKEVKDIVGFMGAIQAQDYAMAKWAIGVRLPGSTERIVTAAVDKGEIIRTHLLRPTWHFASADDIYWMLKLTAPQIKSSMKSRNKELELTESVFKKSNMIIEKALTGRKYLAREDLKNEIEKAKISTSKNRLSHLLLQAELDGIICSGITAGNKQSYALLSERVLNKKILEREEALAKLAGTYFQSRCPATLADFAWWSGLSVKDARSALESVKSSFIPETFNSETYWLSNSYSASQDFSNMVHILPAYDEYLLSYKDRNAVITFNGSKKTISNNGIFRPVIILNGRVIGVWKRTTKTDRVIIEVELFRSVNQSVKKLIEKRLLDYGRFLSKRIEIIFT